MSARTARRRHLRSAAAGIVVAAVAGTALLPLTAYAAPAEDGKPVLTVELGAPAPAGPLMRGGAAQTFELTVKNPSDKAAPFHPWLLATPAGASPLQKADIVYEVEPVDAPATQYLVGQQDGGWQGLFHPAGKPGTGFDVPAGGALKWKVTIGLGKDYPTNDGDLALTATSLAHEVAKPDAHTFKASPSMTPGKLNTRLEEAGPCEPGAGADLCQELKLTYRQTGDGAFASALATRLTASVAGGGISNTAADLRISAQSGGRWEELTADAADGTYHLPVIAKGFGSASGERVARLRVTFGPKTRLTQITKVTLKASIGLATGNGYPFADASAFAAVTPAKPVPTTQPTGPAATPSATPSATPAATAPATPRATPPASAAATTTTPVNAAKTAGGALAHTGSDDRTGLYAGLAAALVALGSAAAWLGVRRRRSIGA
ncbi:hypothetical protein [Streptomyces sp. NPDC058612]|uniref:hypothetical protein n=1 Tax=Streptomyces sp. NPDC058612 TaxID=3346555 RepID=UPI003648EA89